jgi:membrane fusion protein (multidrug efflux system)
VIGSLPFKEGSLVNPNVEMPLTTVSDTKNVHAYFTMNENNNCSLNQTFKGVTASEALKSTAAVSLILVDNSEYDQKVKLPL